MKRDPMRQAVRPGIGARKGLSKTVRPPSDTDDQDKRAPPPKKRARILTYVKCEQNFDGSHPVENECRWHSGVLEADYESDIWMEREGNSMA